MPEDSKPVVQDHGEEFTALLRTLYDTHKRLQELTGGQGDAIPLPGGKSHFLDQADAELRVCEALQRDYAAMQSSILNALQANIALIDHNGGIICVNDAWRRFANTNGLACRGAALGENYLEVCERSEGASAEEALPAAEGIRAVLSGAAGAFVLEYPCDSPVEPRWFRLMVSPTGNGGEAGAVIMHVDITERKIAEQEKQELLFDLGERVKELRAVHAIADVLRDDAMSTSELLEKVAALLPGAVCHPAFASAQAAYGSITRTTPNFQETPWTLEARFTTRAGIGGMVRITYVQEQHSKGGAQFLPEERTLIDHVAEMLRAHFERVAAARALLESNQEFDQQNAALKVLTEKQKDLTTQLEKERARLVAAQAVAKTGSWETDLETHEVVWSAETFRIFEQTPDDFRPTRESFLQLVHPEDRTAVITAIALSADRSMPTEIQHRAVMPDGRIKFVEERWQVFRDEQDVPVCHLGTCRDITEARQAHEALRLSEERFSLLSKATNDAIWDWDLVTKTVWWNEGFEVLFGLYPGETSPDHEGWAARVHPDERARVRAHLRDTISQGVSTFADEYRFLRTDGSYAYVLDRGYVIRNAQGRPIRMIGGMTDLSEQKLAEEQIAEQAALIDQARDAILVRNSESRVISWNKGAERIYGWSSEEAVGRRLDELLEIDSAKMQEADRILLETGVWSGELVKVARSGAKVTLDCRWTLLRDGQGGSPRYLQIDTDVTERKQLEQQFFRAQRMEGIGTLAGGIAHDLNNVLGPIMMALDLLKSGLQEPTKMELIDIIESSAHRAADMVRQVLSFARGVEGQRVEVQVGHVLRDIEKIATDTFLKHVQVHMTVTANLWTIIGDPTQLHQVLLNLCVNARDAMPTGGLLTISAENITVDAHYAGLILGAKPGPYVLIVVVDTGTGMPPAVLEKIFDPFFTTKDIGMGTGLGLSTSLAIIKSHEGFIRVYSEPGKGTKFKAYFPAHPRSAQSSPVVPKVEMPRGNGELILIVDDEAPVRTITGQTLEAYGYRIVFASDGAEAIAVYAAEGEKIAAVLTDMMMPLMDGPATIQVLRKINPRVRIIAASGLASKAQQLLLESLGVQHLLPKPYTTERLLTTLRQLLDDKPAG